MRRSKLGLVASLALACATVAQAQAQAQAPALKGGNVKPNGLRDTMVVVDKPLDRASVADGFTFLASGDLLGPHFPMTGTNEPEFSKIVRLVQSADVAFANHETSAFDLNNYPGTQAAQNGGGYPRFDLALERDFKAMGLDIVSLANNHAGDWGEAGIPATIATLTQAGLVYAGGGSSMAQARQAGLFPTPKGRVALISTASTFNPSSVAADGVGALKPRAGISVLRTTQAIKVTEAEMAALRPLAAARGRVAPDASEVRLGSTTFKVGDAAGFTYAVNKDDETAILASLTEAKRSNDFVAFSIHAHEASGLPGPPTPGDFIQPFFHKAIDAGADVIIRHGPHSVQGVEIYKGKPIFYDLGSLFYAVGGAEKSLGPGQTFGDDSYESAIAVTEYKAGKASVIRIYPIVNTTTKLTTFGAPEPASPEKAQAILKKIQDGSRTYGTDMRIENGVGVIRIAG